MAGILQMRFDRKLGTGVPMFEQVMVFDRLRFECSIDSG